MPDRKVRRSSITVPRTSRKNAWCLDMSVRLLSKTSSATSSSPTTSMPLPPLTAQHNTNTCMLPCCKYQAQDATGDAALRLSSPSGLQQVTDTACLRQQSPHWPHCQGLALLLAPQHWYITRLNSCPLGGLHGLQSPMMRVPCARNGAISALSINPSSPYWI